MVCKSPKATIAISRCGQIIRPFDKLHENWLSQKCLVCSLYDDGGEEVKERNEASLTTLLQEAQTDLYIKQNPITIEKE